MTDLRTDVEEAIEAIRQARGTLKRLRDIRLTVRGAWQQMDAPPEGSAEELRRRLAEVVTAWAKDMNLLMEPAWQVKVDSQYAADTYGLEMALPALWQRCDE